MQISETTSPDFPSRRLFIVGEGSRAGRSEKGKKGANSSLVALFFEVHDDGSGSPR